MPKPNYQTITISKPFGGWISTPSGTTSGGSAGAGGAPATLDASIEGADNQYAHSSAISFFRLEFFGHMAPGETFSAITDSGSKINELPLNGDADSNGSGFIVLRSGKMVSIDDLAGTPLTGDATVITNAGVHAVGTHTIQSTRNPDLIVIKDNAIPTPNEYIVWSWEDSSDGDVAICKATAAGLLTNGIHNWFSSLAGASETVWPNVPLKLTQGPDGNIYFTNRNAIASATMAAGVALTSATANSNALNLGSGWIASGITNFKNYVVACGYRGTTASGGGSRGAVKVWFWDGFSPEPNFIYDVADNVANGVFFDDENLWLITSGRDNSVKIWQFTGIGFKVVFQTGLIGFGGTTPLQGNLENYQDGLCFVGLDRRLYQWYKGGLHQRTTVNKDGTIISGDQTVGMLKNLAQNKLFVGVNTSGSTYEVLYQDQFSEYVVNADFRTKLYVLPYRSKIRRIKLYFSQFGAGASVRVSLFSDYDVLSLGGGTDLLDYTITQAQFGNLKYHEIPVNKSNINSFYLNIRFNHASVTDVAAIIRKIEIDWEPSDA